MPTHVAIDAGLALLFVAVVLVAGDYLVAAMRFALACAVGVGCYLVLDSVAAGSAFAVGVNPATVLAAGVLGLPGVMLAVLARLMFAHP